MTSLDPAVWHEELRLHADWLDRLDPRLPTELRQQQQRLREAIG